MALQASASLGDPGPAGTALLDRSPSVRAVAQWALRQTGAEPGDYYRERLIAQQDPRAIPGLGETGNAGDAHLLSPFLVHQRPRTRAAAVRALRRLGQVQPEEVLPLLGIPHQPWCAKWWARCDASPAGWTDSSSATG